MLSKIYSREPVRGVAYYLLTAARKLGRLTRCNILELNAPIGPMYDIAKRFGFEDGERFNPSHEPVVTGYETPLTIL